MAKARGEADRPTDSTRDRLIGASMRLFGERGYAATTVADIEAASGLSPGGGGLYRHFRSKRALLEAGVDAHIAANQELLEQLTDALHAESSRFEVLRELAQAGLARLRAEADLNRLVIRDLKHFPELLARSAKADIAPVHAGLAGWLSRQPAAGSVDVEAIAAVLMGSITHFWLMQDIYGSHPMQVEENDYVDALVAMIEAVLDTRRSR